MSSSGTCAHSPAPCSLIDIHERSPELAGPPLAPVLFTDESRFTHVTGVKEFGENVGTVMLPVTSSTMTCLSVGQWWSGEACPWRGWTDLHVIVNGTLTTVWYQDEILIAIVRPYAGRGAGQCPARTLVLATCTAIRRIALWVQVYVCMQCTLPSNHIAEIVLEL